MEGGVGKGVGGDFGEEGVGGRILLHAIKCGRECVGSVIQVRIRVHTLPYLKNKKPFAYLSIGKESNTE